MFPIFSYFPIFFLFLFNFVFPVRIIPDPVTVITANTTHNATWLEFARFLDAEKGSHLSGMAELKKYLSRFGYLPISNTNFSDIFDTELESAVLLYQKKLGLPVTGKLDSDTISMFMSPRCGVSDTTYTTTTTIHTTKHYSYFYGKPRWVRFSSPMILTYAFSTNNMIDYISLTDIKAVFKRAFTRWSSVIPVNFAETESYESADIKIGFYRGDHGDGVPFDGVLGVLAHSFAPENGRFHLDASETWAIDLEWDKSRVAVDLESVATHEIGHVLGLAHTSVKEAVMYPTLSPRTKKVDLKMDDVEGVQALYGGKWKRNWKKKTPQTRQFSRIGQKTDQLPISQLSPKEYAYPNPEKEGAIMALLNIQGFCGDKFKLDVSKRMEGSPFVAMWCGAPACSTQVQNPSEPVTVVSEF